MKLLKRVQINMIRNSGKSFLMLTLTVLLGTIVAGAVIVSQAIHQTTLQARGNIPPIATIIVDMEAVLNADDEALDIGYVNHITLNQIANLPYVTQVDESLLWPGLTWLDIYFPDIESEYFIRDENPLDNWPRLRTLNARGVSNVSAVHLTNGLFNLVEGRLFDESDLQAQTDVYHPTPIIIPQIIAELNDLMVGSIITLHSHHFELPDNANVPEGGFVGVDIFDHPYNNWIEVPYEFVVIGLVDVDYTLALHSEAFYMQIFVYNVAFIPNWKIEMIWKAQFPTSLVAREVFNETGRTLEEILTPTIFFVIDDSLNLESFRVAGDALLPEFYRIDTWEHVVTPLENGLNQISMIVQSSLWVGILAILLVLVLLLFLFMSDRRHELGIYIALGKKKRDVFLQVALETVIISTVGMIIAMVIGNLIANEVNQYMVSNAIGQGDIWRTGSTVIGGFQEFSQLEFQGIGRELALEELISFFDVSLSARTIVLFFIIGIGTVLLALIISSYYLFKLNVKNLLMKGKIG